MHVFWAVFVLAVSACSGDSVPASGRPVLTVAAAADLEGAFVALGEGFTRETGARVVFQFGSSGDLARQIAQGARVDLFASASEEYVADLVRQGAASPETERVYALGRLALVVGKAGTGYRPATLEELARPEVRRIALANPEPAPYGRAAREALQKAGLWERVASKVVYGENVRQALQYVQTGNAEAGLVALSIADVPEVASYAVADSLYTPLRQSLVVVKGAKEEQLARAFAAYVVGSEGQAVLARYGFAPPDGR